MWRWLMSIRLRFRHRSRLLGGGALRALWGRLKGKLRQFQTTGTIRVPGLRLRGLLTFSTGAQALGLTRLRGTLARLRGTLLTLVPPTAVLTGTASSGWYESEVVAGGQTLILTLTGTTWPAAGATFDARRQEIIDSFVASTC